MVPLFFYFRLSMLPTLLYQHVFYDPQGEFGTQHATQTRQSTCQKKLRWIATVENFAKALTYYLEPAEGTSKEEFINTLAYSVLVEKSGIIPLDNSSLLSTTNILNNFRDVQHPIPDSS